MLALALVPEASPARAEEADAATLSFLQESPQPRAFLEMHRTKIAAALGSCALPIREALAVVYPELLRYSRFRDQLETSLLESIYVAGGFGDFSIGPFQMKPSFAATLEGATGPATRAGEEGRRDRAARVERLSSLDGQLEYLCRFSEAMRRRHPAWWQLTASQRIRRIAAAYNAGDADDAEIQRRADFRHFPGSVWRAANLRYTDVAVAAYEQALNDWPAEARPRGP